MAVGERAVDPASRRVAVQVVSQAVSLLVVLAGSPAASQGISQRHKLSRLLRSADSDPWAISMASMVKQRNGYPGAHCRAP